MKYGRGDGEASEQMAKMSCASDLTTWRDRAWETP